MKKKTIWLSLAALALISLALVFKFHSYGYMWFVVGK
jgi:hypothetical protein